jgi:hypothetical protein
VAQLGALISEFYAYRHSVEEFYIRLWERVNLKVPFAEEYVEFGAQLSK